MKKSLKEMTLEELWQLFPILLTPHRDEWKEWAREEIATLSRLLADFYPVISHIGSTALPAIQAKPIVDILVEISPEHDMQRRKPLMEAAGYIGLSDTGIRISFNKGYTEDGYAEKVFHIHVHRTGDNDEIYFRDYLTSHPDAAREYEKLKLSLLPKYRNDRDGYTEAKSAFIREILKKAKSR